jgi:hypothetical protein
MSAILIIIAFKPFVDLFTYFYNFELIVAIYFYFISRISRPRIQPMFTYLSAKKHSFDTRHRDDYFNATFRIHESLMLSIAFIKFSPPAHRHRRRLLSPLNAAASAHRPATIRKASSA